MRTAILVSGLVLTAMWLPGCVVVHTEEEHVPSRPRTAGPDDATIREIDTVGKLSFDNDRRAGFKNIAQREELSDRAQVHLVEVAFKRLSFENSKVDVLTTLIQNPCFSPAAKAAILERLDRLSFENNKTQILDAINRREV
jgi:hypothetical protein